MCLSSGIQRAIVPGMHMYCIYTLSFMYETAGCILKTINGQFHMLHFTDHYDNCRLLNWKGIIVPVATCLFP